MRTPLYATLALVALVAASVSGTTVVRNSKVYGDYIEARTASVFAGACHYNGEYPVLGRDAVMAWNFTSGSFNGVDLAGVRAIAAVSCETNLAEPQGTHKTDLTIDSSATAAQADAVVELLKTRNAAQLGRIVAVHRGQVTFTHSSQGYTIESPGFASMLVQYMPDNACCKEPGSVWYTPLTSLENRKVGFTEFANYSGAANTPWQRESENSAFYGTFAY